MSKESPRADAAFHSVYAKKLPTMENYQSAITILVEKMVRQAKLKETYSRPFLRTNSVVKVGSP